MTTKRIVSNKQAIQEQNDSDPLEDNKTINPKNTVFVKNKPKTEDSQTIIANSRQQNPRQIQSLQPSLQISYQQLYEANFVQSQHEKKQKQEYDEKFIQCPIEDDEEDNLESEDEYEKCIGKYDYKKYLEQIQKEGRIKKTIRIKDLNNKPLEGKQFRPLPLPKELKNQEDRKNPDRYVYFSKEKEARYQIDQVYTVQQIESYFTESMHQHKVNFIEDTYSFNRLVIIQGQKNYIRLIKITDKVFYHMLFLSIFEHYIFYSPTCKELYQFLTELSRLENSQRKYSTASYENSYNYFISLFNNLHESLQNLLKPDAKEPEQQRPLVLTILQSSIIKCEELRMIFDNYISKRDDEQNKIEKQVKRLTEIQNLIFDQNLLRQNMKEINLVVKALNLKLSITDNKQNWHFDFNKSGEIHARFMIDQCEYTKEKKLFIMYDQRLFNRLTQQLPSGDPVPSISQEQLQQQQQSQQYQQNEIPLHQQEQQNPQQQSQELIQSSAQQKQQGPQQQQQKQPVNQLKTQIFQNPFKITSKTSCCQNEIDTSKLFRVNGCDHYLCKDCINSPFKNSADKCLSQHCHQPIQEQELMRFMGSLDFEYELKCSLCRANEVIRKIKYNVQQKPQSANINEGVCFSCKSQQEQEKMKNRCQNCNLKDLTFIKRNMYLQCTNCKFLSCKQCNKIIDRQGKSEVSCKCRCLLCLELKKNESQDKHNNNYQLCPDCDLTCNICRIQRRQDNVYQCKECQFFACIPCIFKISAIQNLNSKYIQKCPHFMKHYQFMNQNILPKINIDKLDQIIQK